MDAGHRLEQHRAVWRLITDYYNLYTIQLTAWTDAFGFDPRVSANSINIMDYEQEKEIIRSIAESSNKYNGLIVFIGIILILILLFCLIFVGIKMKIHENLWLAVPLVVLLVFSMFGLSYIIDEIAFALRKRDARRMFPKRLKRTINFK